METSIPKSATYDLAPTVDIFVIWDKFDRSGENVFNRLLNHYHSSAYSGLVGGGIEVYCRQASWDDNDGAPRPIFSIGKHVKESRYKVVIPIISHHLEKTVSRNHCWAEYFRQLESKLLPNGKGPRSLDKDMMCLIPVIVDHHWPINGTLQHMLEVQGVNYSSLEPGKLEVHEYGTRTLERDVSQAIAQSLVSEWDRDHPLQIFVSYARSDSEMETSTKASDVGTQVANLVLDRLNDTRLAQFFDCRNIQLGEPWQLQLEEGISRRSAILMVRTDMYSSRMWTQREIRLAKEQDIPVVALSALTGGEERGSFLLDHVPTVAYHPANLSYEYADEQQKDSKRRQRWSRLQQYQSDFCIDRAICRLVDETLKHAIWRSMKKDLFADFDWSPAHPPEPMTVTDYLSKNDPGDSFRVVYPDPPITCEEQKVIKRICQLYNADMKVQFITPRDLALYPEMNSGKSKPLDSLLKDVTIGVTASIPAERDAASLGVSPKHLDFVIAGLAMHTFRMGGSIVYGGGRTLEKRKRFSSLLIEQAVLYRRNLEWNKSSGSPSSGYQRGTVTGDFHHPLFINYLPRATFEELYNIDQGRRVEEMERDLGNLGLMRVVMSPDETISVREAAMKSEASSRDCGAMTESLNSVEEMTKARQVLVDRSTVRVLLGGKVENRANSSDEEDSVLGTLEEALLTLEAGKPLYISGAFGGVGTLLARELSLADSSMFPSVPSRSFLSPKNSEYLDRVCSIWNENDAASMTGLSQDELAQFALTTRPEEMIRMLISGTANVSR